VYRVPWASTPWTPWFTWCFDHLVQATKDEDGNTDVIIVVKLAASGSALPPTT